MLYIVEQPQNNPPPIVPFAEQSQITQTQTEKPPKKTLNALRVLSIVGIIWFPLSLLIFFSASEYYQVYSCTFIIFGFAFVHANVAIAQGTKLKIPVLTVMGIIGLIWYALSAFCILDFMNDDLVNASQGWAALGILYLLILSIVTFIKSGIKKQPR